MLIRPIRHCGGDFLDAVHIQSQATNTKEYHRPKEYFQYIYAF